MKKYISRTVMTSTFLQFLQRYDLTPQTLHQSCRSFLRIIASTPSW